MQGVRTKRCSKCGEVEHYKNNCRNPQANFNANYERDIVAVEDLLDETYSNVHGI